MDSTNKTLLQAEQQCIARGTRLTTKRKQVLASLLKSDKALSAYELIELCEQLYGETLSAMSMYRILDFLKAEHLAHRLDLANKYVACSHICSGHHNDTPQFLICRMCNRVSEISVKPDTISTLKESVTDAGFEFASQQLEMSCVCNKCKRDATKTDSFLTKSARQKTINIP